MESIKPRYLEKEERYYKISTKQLCVLMMNTFLARDVDEIGWQHARETFENFYNRLKTTSWIQQSDLETALWASNMLHEQDKFWHPDKTSLNMFVRSILKEDERFEYYYNWITEDIGERKLIHAKKEKK